MNTTGYKCPACTSNNLYEGVITEFGSGSKFSVIGRWTWRSYGVRAFACLDCGYVGQFLPKDALSKLQSKVSS